MDASGETIKEVKEIKSDLAQLSELKDLEQTQLGELVDVLRTLQEGSGITTALNTKVMPGELGRSKQLMIGAGAIIQGIDENGKPFSVELSKLKPADLVAVVVGWVPSIKAKVMEERNETENRLEFVEKLVGELREASGSLAQKAQTQPGEETDIVRDSVAQES